MHPVVVMLGESVPQHLDVDRRLAGADHLGAARPSNRDAAAGEQHEPRATLGGPHVVAYVAGRESPSSSALA